MTHDLHIAAELGPDNYRWGPINIPRQLSPRADWRQIAAEVLDPYGLTLADILRSDHRRPIAYARQHVMAALHATGRGYAPIGRLLKRDHTTVIWGVRAHKARQAIAA